MNMRPIDNLGITLQNIATSLARSNDQLLQAKLGVSFSQFKILAVLLDRPHIRQKEIAQYLGQTEASVSRQIKNMYEDGLLQAVPRREDRREHITTLTKRGERIATSATRLLNQANAPLLQRLSSNEQNVLQSAIRSISSLISFK